MATKKSRGRQKIDIVKIENEETPQVAFSKGRSGLFKKASNPCTLTSSKVALVVFAPSEKGKYLGRPSPRATWWAQQSRLSHI